MGDHVFYGSTLVSLLLIEVVNHQVKPFSNQSPPDTFAVAFMIFHAILMYYDQTLNLILQTTQKYSVYLAELQFSLFKSQTPFLSSANFLFPF